MFTQEQHQDLANFYYDLVTDFYEYGWGTSFHFAPRHKFEVTFLSFIVSSFLFFIISHRLSTRALPVMSTTWLWRWKWVNTKHFFSIDFSRYSISTTKTKYLFLNKYKIEKGHKILDVGCGVGGPAREIARFSEAHVTGLNNNAYQVESLSFSLSFSLIFWRTVFWLADYESEIAHCERGLGWSCWLH